MTDKSLPVWVQLPDEHRGTGRTTRMVEAIKAHDERPVVVIAANTAQSRLIKQLVRSAGVDMAGIIFTTINSDETRMRGLPMHTKRFYDHVAVELWQRRKIEKVMATAQRMLRESL